MESRKILIYLAIKYRGDWDAIYEAVKNRVLMKPQDIEDAVSTLSCNAITFFDKEYPEELKKIFRPPFVLFYEGNISLLNNGIRNKIAIVGTREPSAYSISALEKIVEGLNENIVVVSGLAKGIDGYSHRFAIKYKRNTIAILGSGLDYCYPIENEDIYNEIKEKHLLMSEYPPGVVPSQDKFPARNRIIMGLSKVVFVPEAKRRSGSMITVALALDAGKDILCLPSNNYGDSGCNLCIKNGAHLVENADDINDFFDL